MKRCDNDNINILLSQWQTSVEMANAISQRRDSMNNIYVTLNLAITTTISLIGDLKSIVNADVVVSWNTDSIVAAICS